MYYLGFTYIEAYNVPIFQRNWFVNRLNEEIKKSQDEQGNQTQPTRAYHQNTPDARAMMNRHRSQVPANLRRFT